jgi:hypothetical protein
LADDYFPQASIQLEPLPSVTVRGAVFDERHGAVPGAQVAIEGDLEVATTNEMGNFQIATHAADRQIVTVIAQKGDLTAKVSVPAGNGVELVLRKHDLP